MSELKTLKDFDCGCGVSCDCSEMTKGSIKEEAIKWYHKSDGNKHKFIIEFFNITEEEILEGSHKNTGEEK